MTGSVKMKLPHLLDIIKLASYCFCNEFVIANEECDGKGVARINISDPQNITFIQIILKEICWVSGTGLISMGTDEDELLHQVSRGFRIYEEWLKRGVRMVPLIEKKIEPIVEIIEDEEQLVFKFQKDELVLKSTPVFCQDHLKFPLGVKKDMDVCAEVECIELVKLCHYFHSGGNCELTIVDGHIDAKLTPEVIYPFIPCSKQTHPHYEGNFSVEARIPAKTEPDVIATGLYEFDYISSYISSVSKMVDKFRIRMNSSETFPICIEAENETWKLTFFLAPKVVGEDRI